MPKARVVSDEVKYAHLVPSKAGKLVQALTKGINKALDGMPKGNVVVHTTSKASGPNPKDVVGSAKAAMLLFPPIALVHAVDAMMDGAGKYDPYNWRAKSITTSNYLHAAVRHIIDYWEGEECASDSKAKHLGHALATLAIVLDAQAHGCLIDDRPMSDGGKAVNDALNVVKANEAYRKAKRAEAVQSLCEAIGLKKDGARSGRCSGKKRNAAGTPKVKK